MKTHKSQYGIGLVEILIALLIGLFLMGGLIQLFIASKQTYKMQDTVGHLQENQRFALDFLVHDMRGIGGWGCFKWPDSAVTGSANLNLVQSLLNAQTTGAFVAPTVGISGENNHVSTGSGDPILTGTDTITLRSTSALQTSAGGDVALTVSPSSITADLTVSAGSIYNASYSSGINTNDILFIGDCDGGNIFQVSGINATNSTIAHAVVAATATYPGNASNSLTKSSGLAYDTSARLYKLNTVTYSIRQGTRYLSGAYRTPSLYQQVDNGSANELIEGVEDMQILYGEDTDTIADGTPNRYMPAGTSGLNMANVVSVQMSLLMASLEDNQASAPVSYSFNNHKYDGVTVDADGTTYPLPTDKRLRRSVTSIISIRNRLN